MGQIALLFVVRRYEFLNVSKRAICKIYRVLLQQQDTLPAWRFRFERQLT